MIAGQTERGGDTSADEEKFRCAKIASTDVRTFLEAGVASEPELLPDVEHRPLAHLVPVLEHEVHFDLDKVAA